MPTANTEFAGRFISALVLLFTAVFFAFVTLNGHGLEVFTSDSEIYTEGFPPWDQSGAIFNGTTNTSGELQIDASSAGTYTYTTPVIDSNRLIEISDFTYQASLREDQGQSIALKVYTSDDGFETIESSQTFQLTDGVGSRVVDLPRERDYRVQILMSYSGSGNEPVLESLDLEGKTFSKNEDFTPLFTTIAFWLLMIMSVFVVVPTGN